MNYDPFYYSNFNDQPLPNFYPPLYSDWYCQNHYLFDDESDRIGKKTFTKEEALRIGEYIGINFNETLFDVEQFRMGLEVELEHGTICPQTNVTNDDLIEMGKIALVHLYELPDYYTRLKTMEDEGEAYWSSKNYQNPCY